MKHSRIVVILSGFPRRSETFALHEVLALEERGLLAAIFATKPGDGLSLQPGSERLMKRVQRLPPGPPAQQATVLAEQLRECSVSGIHAYFAHAPTEVAAHAARQLNVPFGFSIHAKDARKVAPDELARRARAAACVVACNPDVAQEVDGVGVAVRLIPHGVDTERFQPQPAQPPERLRLVAVGRLVEKKGFAVLIEAVAKLSAPFFLRIIGDGPERASLQAAIVAANLSDRIKLCGSLTHHELPAAYGASHVVVAPSIVDHMGDRDGLPNVVLEAMACGRPVIASAVGAVSSAISSEVSGLLVPPGDANALAAALERLASDPLRRATLGQGARLRVEEAYDLRRCTERFCQFLAETYTS